MADTRRPTPLRLDQDVYDQVKTLADAETGENVSKMLRKLVDEALAARSENVSRVSRVSHPAVETTPTPRPATKASPMPDPSDKLAYARWLRERR